MSRKTILEIFVFLVLGIVALAGWVRRRNPPMQEIHLDAEPSSPLKAEPTRMTNRPVPLLKTTILQTSMGPVPMPK